MTTLLFRGGVSDPTTQVSVGFWPDTIGDYVLTFNGVAETINVASVADRVGCTWRTFSGLASGASYSCTVTGPGGNAEMTARTTATSRHVTVYGSCFDYVFRFDRAAPAMIAEAPDQVISLGDAPYIDGSDQYSTTPTDTILRYQHWRLFERRPFLDLAQAGNFVRAASDHDYLPGNDAPGRDDGVAGAAGGATFNGADACNDRGITCADEPAWIAMQAANRAIWQSLNRWPTNPDIGVTYGGGPVPADAEYTRWTVGRVEYFLLDMLAYADYRANTADTDRTLVGAVQLAWLLARVAASTAPFKCLMFPHELLKGASLGTGRRPDYGHSNFSDERTVILSALTDTTAWTVPGGVFVLSGDVHDPTVYLHTAGEGLLQLTPCPSGTDMTDISATPGVSTQTNTRWLWWEQKPAAGNPITRYYGTIEDEGSGPLVLRLKDSGGNTRYKALIEPGSNTPTYTRQRVGR